jgi:hypothetical protein
MKDWSSVKSADDIQFAPVPAMAKVAANAFHNRGDSFSTIKKKLSHGEAWTSLRRQSRHWLETGFLNPASRTPSSSMLPWIQPRPFAALTVWQID